MLAAIVLLTISTQAIAVGGQEVTTEFFSDASKTKLVGEIIVGCGAHGHWGTKTAFYSHSSSPCNGARAKGGSSIAATSLMHHDPVLACTFRCNLIHLRSCPPPSPEQPECVQPREQCLAGCQQLLNTE